MDCKISSTKLACIVAYLLFACFFQLLTANEEVKLNDELKVIQLPEANSEALDGVSQVFVTRYDRQHVVGPKKIGVCIDPPPCGSDSELPTGSRIENELISSNLSVCSELLQLLNRSPAQMEQTYAVHFEYQRLMQFLLGLNESYNQCRSQIMIDPAPSVNKAYSLVIAEKSQTILGKANSVSVGDASSNTRHMNEALAFFSGNNPNHNFSSSSGSGSGGLGVDVSNFRFKKNSNSHLYCDYCCNWKGHTRDRCYKLHGYPSDRKGKKMTSPNTANFAGSTTSPAGSSGQPSSGGPLQ